MTIDDIKKYRLYCNPKKLAKHLGCFAPFEMQEVSFEELRRWRRMLPSTLEGIHGQTSSDPVFGGKWTKGPCVGSWSTSLEPQEQTVMVSLSRL